MFIGHFALGLGAKRALPAVSLGTLFLAVQLADLLWPTLVLLGVEQVEIDPGNTAFTPLRFVSYPYSHSLAALVLWGTLFAAIYRNVMRSTLAVGLFIAGLVVSHWLLDVVAHRADMPLTVSAGTRVGLGLWNSVVATVVVEAAMLIAGLTFYLKTTRARDRIGSVGFWALIAFLVLVNLANIVGPPPPGPRAVAWAAQAMWLIVAWAFWVDRHRVSSR